MGTARLYLEVEDGRHFPDILSARRSDDHAIKRKAKSRLLGETFSEIHEVQLLDSHI